MISRCTGNYNN